MIEPKFSPIAALANSNADSRISGTPLTTFHNIGKKLSTKNVFAVSANAIRAGSTSSPSAKSPSKLCAAAFIALNEPVKVVDASFAVVPVISRLS